MLCILVVAVAGGGMNDDDNGDDNNDDNNRRGEDKNDSDTGVVKASIGQTPIVIVIAINVMRAI